MKVWICELNNNDSQCYYPLHKTKKVLLADIKCIQGYEPKYRDNYELYEVYQVNVDTSDVFQLLEHATSEGGGRRAITLGDIIQQYKVVKIKGKFALKKIQKP